MITEITSLPNNLIGFVATGKVTAEDFAGTVLPSVASFIKEHDKINYILVLKTSPSDFTMGAWLQDAWLGLRDLRKWNRVAIVTDHETVEKITPIFSKIMIGEFRTYSFIEYDEAVLWASEQL